MVFARGRQTSVLSADEERRLEDYFAYGDDYADGGNAATATPATKTTSTETPQTVTLDNPTEGTQSPGGSTSVAPENSVASTIPGGTTPTTTPRGTTPTTTPRGTTPGDSSTQTAAPSSGATAPVEGIAGSTSPVDAKTNVPGATANPGGLGSPVPGVKSSPPIPDRPDIPGGNQTVPANDDVEFPGGDDGYNDFGALTNPPVPPENTYVPPSPATFAPSLPSKPGSEQSSPIQIWYLYGVAVLAVIFALWCLYGCCRKRRERNMLQARSAQADRVLGDMQMVPNEDLDNDLL